MSKLLPLIGLLVCNSMAFAQDYIVNKIMTLNNDLYARVNNVKSSDGRDCALIRIDIPSTNNISFDDNVIGKPEYMPGEYNVYVPEHLTSMTLSIKENKCVIDFAKYNTIIEGKKCYRVLLTNKPTQTNHNTHTSITANYDNAVVLIDGIPMGETPLELNNITFGKHIVSVPNTFGVTLKDTIINFNNENKIDLTLHKETIEPIIIDIATPRGDSSTWYEIFGTNVKKENGKQGIIDYAGNIIVPCEFDDIFPDIQNGYYVVTNEHKQGLYEPEKGLVVPCIYDLIFTRKSYYHDAYMPICINNKWGVMSPTGDVVVPIEYENCPQCYKDVIKVEYKKEGYEGAYGLFSYNGSPIVQPKYDCLNDFVNGYAFFMKFNKSEGFVDINGNEKIIPSKYILGHYWGNGGAIFMNGLFHVKDKENDKWGYMNTNLDLIIPTIYDAEDDEAPNFNQGIVLLELNGDKVILNNKGEIILNCREQGYKDIEIVCQSGLVWNKGKFFTYKNSIDGVIENTFVKVINQEKQCGLLDVNGNIIVPCKYQEDEIQWFTDNGNNYFVLTDENELLVKDQTQNLLFKLPSNLTVSEIKDGFVMIHDQESNSYGYLNMEGEILANCIYGYNSESNLSEENIDDSDITGEGYDISCFINDYPISEGLALLNIGDRFGFIDNKGNVKVPLNYTAATPFENGISYVRDQNGKWIKIYKTDL